MHLNDEQFEDALNDPMAAAAHLADCAQCREHLEMLRAIQGRLRAAFDSVSAPETLARRILVVADALNPLPLRERVAARPGEGWQAQRIFRLPRPFIYAAAAAAAILLIAVPTALLLTSAPQAMAAQEQLANIHMQNVQMQMLDGHNHEGHTFYSQDDPEKLAAYFKETLGFKPAMPKLNQGMAIRGCCVAHFRDKIVGSYVVETPRGAVSIIVVKDRPESIGLSRAQPRRPRMLAGQHD